LGFVGQFWRRAFLGTLFVAGSLVCDREARADATVLLEEPYSYDGALAGTGHTAVYLSGVCAETPLRLRPCRPGELGAVLSRYHNVGASDWIAIPLIPYLYAVETTDRIPLVVDAKLVGELRDRYRRAHLEEIAPDAANGSTPGGNWYELIGSAYDRTLYAFQVKTTPQQDAAFIEHYNQQANRETYKVVTKNCADFVRDAMNFYYPKAVGRSIIADWGVATPKHVAKSLVKYAKKHPDTELTSYIIPQVPGTVKRSKPVHGLVDSVFKAKKYEVPLLVFTPFVGGGFAAAYYVGGRFDPAQRALIYEPDEDLAEPITKQRRKSYSEALAELRDLSRPEADRKHPEWREFLANATLTVDAAGRPVLEGTLDGQPVRLGITRENLGDIKIRESEDANTLRLEILVVHLREQLRKGLLRTSDPAVRRDLETLQQLILQEQAARTTRQASLQPRADMD
jgi:hypothetical protein